jgi:hypothetical protein
MQDWIMAYLRMFKCVYYVSERERKWGKCGTWNNFLVKLNSCITQSSKNPTKQEMKALLLPQI